MISKRSQTQKEKYHTFSPILDSEKKEDVIVEETNKEDKGIAGELWIRDRDGW